MAVRPAVPVREPPGPTSPTAWSLPTPERALVLLAATLSIVLPLVQLLDVTFPGRAVVALAFVLLAPGAPLAAVLRLRSVPLFLAMSFATGLSVLLLLSTALVITPFWHPALGIGLMAILDLSLTWPALRALARREPSPPVLVEPRPRTLGLLAVTASAALWVYAVATTNLDELGALGLVRQVGPAYWLGLLLLAGVAADQLRRPVQDNVVLIAMTVALVVELFGFLNFASSAASLSTGWLHVGFAQYIADHGHVLHGYDARFSWPGFFASAAVLSDAGGTPSAASFLKPSHVVDVLLVVPGLWSIARTITGTVPVAWLSVFTFISLDWYEQDYFSPQATVFVLYVAVLALLLHLAPPPQELFGKQAPWRHPFSRLGITVERPEGVSAGLLLGREAALLLLSSAVVVSHQLTPLNLLVILVIMVITGATRMRGLWLMVSLVFIAWFTFGASEYWRSNVGNIFGDIGRIGSTFGSAVGSRLVGDPVHAKMQTVRLLWAAGSVVLALFTIWRLRHTTWVWLLAGLTLGPFSLVFVQSYGGEVALRCFLYSDPVLAPLMAMTVWWALSFLRGGTRAVALGTALLLGFALLTTTRGANASFERETAGDVAAARFIFDDRPPHPGYKTIGLMQSVGFTGFEKVDEWRLVSLDPSSCENAIDTEPCIEDAAPDYLLVTRSMDNQGVLQDGLTPGWTARLSNELVAKGLYARVFTDGSSSVLRRVTAS